MNVKVVIKQKGKPLFEWLIKIKHEDDLADGAKKGITKFRKAFPEKSLLDEDITITFDKA
jgi:hypothetical protein